MNRTDQLLSFGFNKVEGVPYQECLLSDLDIPDQVFNFISERVGRKVIVIENSLIADKLNQSLDEKFLKLNTFDVEEVKINGISGIRIGDGFVFPERSEFLVGKMIKNVLKRC